MHEKMHNQKADEVKKDTEVFNKIGTQNSNKNTYILRNTFMRLRPVYIHFWGLAVTQIASDLTIYSTLYVSTSMGSSSGVTHKYIKIHIVMQ
jgi:hypothetical protein